MLKLLTVALVVAATTTMTAGWAAAQPRMDGAEARAATRTWLHDNLGVNLNAPGDPVRVRVGACWGRAARWSCRGRVGASNVRCRALVRVVERLGKYLAWTARLRCTS